MIEAAAGYCRNTVNRFAEAWNRFWFAPSDPLSLAVMRWTVGLLATLVVASYGFELLRYFGPGGMLSVETMNEMAERREIFRLSPLDLAGDSTTLVALHGIGVAILLAFTVGLWTRVTSILSLIVFLSFFQRARILTTMVEPLLAMLLLYLAVGPSGAVLSVDTWLRRRKSPATAPDAHRLPSYRANLALRLIQVHTALIYFMMFTGKTRGNFVWWNGTAVWWLIARPAAALIDMRGLYDLPYVYNFWTSAIVLFELAFTFLIWNRTARPLMIFISAVMWTGTAVLTGLVPFCLAMFVAGLAFVSADQWRGLVGPKPAT